jgi:nicotinamidase/pyrazinamidase
MRDEVLLVIDVQNDFMPGGALAVAHGDEVVPVINRLARGVLARRADAGLASG